MTSSPRAPRVRRAFVLVGRATRLPGKFFLPLGGEPILGRELRILGSTGRRTIVVSVEPLELPGVEVIVDPRDAGPLGALATILENADPPFFLFGGDMPLVDPRALAVMDRRYRGRSVVPVGPSGRWEVLHAIYAGIPRARIDRWLGAGGGLQDLVQDLDRAGEVDPMPPGEIDVRSFADVDTPADYDRLTREWDGGSATSSGTNRG